MTVDTEMATDSGVRALEAAGRTIVARHNIDFLENGSGLGSAIKSITGGKVTMTRADVIMANGPHGPEVVVHPYANNTPLPGEFHALLPGALRSPAAYDGSGFIGFDWNSPDEQLRAYLRQHKFEAHTIPEELKHGLTKIKLEWTAQLHPIAADRTWFAAQLGGFSATTAHGSVIAVADRLAPAIAQTRAAGPGAPIHLTRLGQLAELAFQGELASALEAGAAPDVRIQPVDPAAARAGVVGALGRSVGKRVCIGAPTDQKRLKNVLAKVAPGVDPTEICGFVDTGLRASGKSGVAFTETGVHINELGDHFAWRYDEIVAFRLDRSELSIYGLDGKSVKIASNTDAIVIMEALVSATGRPG